jgi:MFS family permease
MATEEDRARLVRRTTRLLVVAQVALLGTVGVVATFGPIALFRLTGSESAGAWIIGSYYVSAAAGAVIAGRLMDRRGRRPGLAFGYVLIAISGLIAMASVAGASAAGILVSAGVMGAGAAAALLGRTAVADMYPLERRGRAVGTLVLAGTMGAVGGAPLGAALHGVGGRIGLDPDIAPWLLVPLFAVVALGCVLSVRPDPRDLAVGGGRRPGEGRSPAAILALRPGLVAVLAIGVAQAVMSTFMGVVPVVIHEHGAGELTVSLVVSLHLGGMFGFSRLFGGALDRWGRRPGLGGGVVLSISGVGLSLLAGTMVPAGGLFLIGVGWSAAYVGSTAIVADLATPAERGRALGFTDLVAALAAGTGVLGGALLLEATSFPVLALTAIALLLVPAALLLPLREDGPGRWPQALAAESQRVASS